jgi:hypothetical protein
MEYDEQTKEMLTKTRAREAVRLWKSAEYNELEKAYGDYLFVPLDIPIIQANDQQAFLDFFHKNADYTRRVKKDVAGLETADTIKNYKPTFKTIDSHPTGNSAWSRNYVADLFYNFSEIFEQIYEYYPMDPDTLNFALWSSRGAVQPHRDETSMIDMPINFRLKLFDSNPCETMKLHLSPMDKPSPAAYIFKIPKDTNSWVWNNLRLKHSSVKMVGYEKILMIFFPNYSLNMNKFIDLLDRSISKYKDALIVDTYTTSADYINH